MTNPKTMTLYAGGRGVLVTLTPHARSLILECRYHRPLIAEIKAMRGAKWDRLTKRWRISDCARNRLQLALLAGETPEEIARYDRPPPNVEPRRPQVRAHQRDMIAHLVGRKRCILAAQMRTGKTLAVIEAMEHSAPEGEWLYVAPAKVLAGIERELAKWGSTLKVRLCSYAGLAPLLEEWDGPAPVGVVFDESSRLKSASARRTIAAQHLADAIREEHDGYVWLLTGTPAPLCPVDWWAQAEIACPGFLRESSSKKLEQRLAIYGEAQTGANGKTFAKPVSWKDREVDMLSERLAGLVQVHFLADCLDIPEINYERVMLPPSADTLRSARMLAECAETAAGALNALRQLSDGFQYLATGEAVRGETPKDQALADLLDTHQAQGRVIVYTAFRDSLDRVVDLCESKGWLVLRCDGRGWKPPKGWTTQEALAELDRATDSRCARLLAFVANPGSGGMGLTLSAAACAIYYSQDYNGESRMQSVERGRYPGAESGFRVYDLCHLPTDSKILDSHGRKHGRQHLTMEQIQACLSS